MKKILFSAYSLELGGIETSLVSVINYLAKQNYDITLVLEKNQGMFLNKIDKRIKIIEYSPSYNKSIVISKTKNLLKRICFYLKNKNKFDCACSYATYCKMASMTARIASKNNILWVHNNYYSFFNENSDKYIKFFDSINAHKFKNIIFVSEEAQKQYINKYGILKENTLVCNNLIDYNRIYNLSNENINLKIDKKKKVFLNVGRHDEHQKKLTRLLDAAKRLKEDNEEFILLVVGEGEQTKYYKEIVEKYKLDENIFFIGKTTNPYPYYKISDCIILTSDFEGNPVVYLESKVLNKPIITTNVSDSDKDIAPKYGIVTKKNTEDIYMAMKEFIKNGFDIKEKFDPEQYNKEIIKKIEDIIEERV